jgi:hypothetical protein
MEKEFLRQQIIQELKSIDQLNEDKDMLNQQYIIIKQVNYLI